MKKLSLVIPCYNEAQTIEALLERVEQAPFLDWGKEIIVVDDYSVDGTREILKKYESRVKIVYQEKNGGKGTAVQRGLKEATGSHVLIQDADLEYDPHEIQYLLGALDKGQGQVVFGSRNLHHKKREGFFLSRFGVWGITKLLNVLYGLRLTDAWTCYKLFPREASEDFPGGGFDSELLFTASLARRGLSICEVPISHTPRDVSAGKKIRYRDGFHVIFLLIADKMLHLRKPLNHKVRILPPGLCCPLCHERIVSVDDGYLCNDHGVFQKDKHGRPLLIRSDVFMQGSMDQATGVNWLKSFLKQFPKLYYGIWHVFCPALMVQNGPRKILSLVDRKGILVDVGSGPERLAPEFINVDLTPFPEVDVVADARELPFPDSWADGVVSESLLEHTPYPSESAKEMIRILKPRGILYVSAPFIHPYHASPDDFSRWTVSGLASLFKDIDIIERGVRSGPWSALLLFLAYWLGVVFSFGYKPVAPFLAHIFMLILGPLKYLDIIFARFPGAEAVAAHVYIIGRKRS